MPLPLVVAAAFPAIVATFIRFMIGSFIVKFFFMLAISLVTFTAIDTVGDIIKNYILNQTQSIPGQFAEAAAMIGLFDAVNIVISAYIGSIAIRQVMGLHNRVTFGRSS